MRCTPGASERFDMVKFLRWGWLLAALLGLVWCWALWGVSTDRHQGDVYRILYVHVPSAFAAFAGAFLLLGQSIYSLRKPHSASILWGKSLAEVSLLFTILTLVSGSFWGRPTWGVWWTWDARLTTTLILALLYVGYLVLWSAISSREIKARACAVLGVLIAVDVPVIYKSVTWWRTLHQPPSLLSSETSIPVMADEMRQLLWCSTVLVLAVMLWLSFVRYFTLKTEEQLRSKAMVIPL